MVASQVVKVRHKVVAAPSRWGLNEWPRGGELKRQDGAPVAWATRLLTGP